MVEVPVLTVIQQGPGILQFPGSILIQACSSIQQKIPITILGLVLTQQNVTGAMTLPSLLKYRYESVKTVMHRIQSTAFRPTQTVTGLLTVKLLGGTESTVTLTGSAFTNISESVELTSNVIVTSDDGSSIELIPDALNESTLTVTIPGTLATGNYKLKAVKLVTSSVTPWSSVLNLLYG
jgi:hypothetical protein